jgi:hypothetical protein
MVVSTINGLFSAPGMMIPFTQETTKQKRRLILTSRKSRIPGQGLA